jgi:hypothetical protein
VVKEGVAVMVRAGAGWVAAGQVEVAVERGEEVRAVEG